MTKTTNSNIEKVPAKKPKKYQSVASRGDSGSKRLSNYKWPKFSIEPKVGEKKKYHIL